MTIFQFRGLDSKQSAVRGTVLADSPRHARDQLRTRGIAVQALRPKTQLFSSFGRLGIGSSARHQWAVGAHELSMLLTAGIPLLESLSTMAQQHRGPFRNAILRLQEKVEGGSSLAAAMSDQPDVFDEASVRLVEVGESSGNLDEVLAEIADFKLQLAAFRDKVATALIYPCFLSVFGLAATVFLMTFVMPPLLESLQETLTQLPWPTRVAKWMSDLLIEYGLWIAIALAVALITLAIWSRSYAGRRQIDRFVLKLPLIGPLLVKQSVARTAMIVSLLTRSGVLLTSAMQLAARSTGNSVIRDALLRAEQDMSAGDDIANALEKSGCIPPLAIRFFAVGQDSGRLDEMLQKLARDYNVQVSTATARISALIEPILILVLAIAVAFLLLATILPILEAGNVA